MMNILIYHAHETELWMRSYEMKNRCIKCSRIRDSGKRGGVYLGSRVRACCTRFIGGVAGLARCGSWRRGERGRRGLRSASRGVAGERRAAPTLLVLRRGRWSCGDDGGARVRAGRLGRLRGGVPRLLKAGPGGVRA